MAIINNTPNQGYIYIKDMTILYDNIIYNINNIYTNNKYIYWKIKSSELIPTNNKLDDKEDLIFIIKNIDGVSITTTTDLLEILFDGYNKKSIAEKLKGVTENNKFYKKQSTISSILHRKEH